MYNSLVTEELADYNVQFGGFDRLMPFRVHEILMVASQPQIRPDGDPDLLDPDPGQYRADAVDGLGQLRMRGLESLHGER